MKVIAKYNNGNTLVSLMEDGTKTREYSGIPAITHPESVDVKITNYCDMGCSYCHESSTTKGVHGDLDLLMTTIEALPAGVELAIGGGNPLSHPDLIYFLQRLKRKGIISNLTVNQGHLKKYQELILMLIKEDLVKGVGISITSNNFKYVKPIIKTTKNVVYHVIAGINDVSIINKLMSIGECKVLVLGYKLFGFGVEYYSEEVKRELLMWHKLLPSIIGKCTLSFDNLAIKQLNVKRLFTKEGWDRFYMGDDFKFTMYIDAVNQEYAPTSRSKDRTRFKECSLLEFFDTRNSAKPPIK